MTAACAPMLQIQNFGNIFIFLLCLTIVICEKTPINFAGLNVLYHDTKQVIIKEKTATLAEIIEIHAFVSIFSTPILNDQFFYYLNRISD